MRFAKGAFSFRCTVTVFCVITFILTLSHILRWKPYQQPDEQSQSTQDWLKQPNVQVHMENHHMFHIANSKVSTSTSHNNRRIPFIENSLSQKKLLRGLISSPILKTNDHKAPLAPNEHGLNPSTEHDHNSSGGLHDETRTTKSIYVFPPKSDNGFNDNSIPVLFEPEVNIISPKNSNSSELPNSSTGGVNIKNFADILQMYASDDHWIMLALIDQGCLDMAVNFYKSSIQKFAITNYLFIGANQETCSRIHQFNINCFVYKTDKDAGKPSVYLSKDFLRKMNIRTYLILDALQLGYNILHTDVDMTFLKNPFKDMNYQSENYDIAPLWDCGAFNAGFLFIRNSKPSRELYKISKHIADTEPKTDDQKALNRAIGSAKKKYGLKLFQLSTKKYLCGMTFWEGGKRCFVGSKPCPECVVVHNNWIVSMEAKTYRLKELNWWIYDKDGYYSSLSTKYLYFENPHHFDKSEDLKREEVDALKSAFAIGEILNRTIILPRFHCGKKLDEPCSIISYLLLRQLQTVYPNYRENSFLIHPIVPDSVKSAKTNVHYISSDQNGFVKLNAANVTVHKTADAKHGATDKEIIEWFSSSKEPVLRFHSLYKAFYRYTDSQKNEVYKQKIAKAFKSGSYRQF